MNFSLAVFRVLSYSFFIVLCRVWYRIIIHRWLWNHLLCSARSFCIKLCDKYLV